MVEVAEKTATQSVSRKRAANVDHYVGHRIRERRIFLGLTTQQVADLIGVTSQQALRYERGINSIASGRLYAIARGLGVDVSYFFAGVPDEDPAFKVPTQERMLLNLVRNFMAITDRERQREAYALVRALAENQNVESESNDPQAPVNAAPVRFVVKLMDAWDIDEKEASRLLGFEDEKAFSELASGAATLDSRDIKDRVRHLLRTREALHSLFRDIDTEREWLREPRSELNGQSPLALLLEGSMENFLVVSQFVQWMVGR
jgi:transcriptional regulator with XRE-family HTH domain